MLRRVLLVAIALVAACKAGEKNSPYNISEPVSVRGWITDVAGAKRAETMEQEVARRTQMFVSSSVWVENFEYSSGGIAENGSFIILDVPPNNTTIGFNAPGAETAKIVLQNIPGNADVFIPNVILQNGGAKVLDPKALQVRVPGYGDKAKPTGKTAIVAGYPVPVMETPLSELNNRRDYPQPTGFRPVATVK
jgi:hypothetical protein